MARLPVLSLPSGGPSQDPFERNGRTLPSRVKPGWAGAGDGRVSGFCTLLCAYFLRKATQGWGFGRDRMSAPHPRDRAAPFFPTQLTLRS